MTESLRQFMAGIIDYAGLFPPANLPLNKAIRNYARYRQTAHSWMLSRFILPVSLFHEAGRFADELFTADEPFAFSVLPRKVKTVDKFRSETAETITNCIDFCNSNSGCVTTRMMEVKLPMEDSLLRDENQLKNLFNETATKLKASSLSPSQVFYEVPFGESWKNDNEAVIKALSAHNTAFSDAENYQFAAYKIRCGGVTASLFPTVEQIAFILNLARDHNVAIKGTAGLHHPVRHYAEEVETKMHGFLNVFGGAMLAHANDISFDTLVEILNEENAQAFHFTDNEFSWSGYSISAGEIQQLRSKALLSYGSCSFDEPREDLQKLGLM